MDKYVKLVEEYSSQEITEAAKKKKSAVSVDDLKKELQELKKELAKGRKVIKDQEKRNNEIEDRLPRLTDEINSLEGKKKDCPWENMDEALKAMRDIAKKDPEVKSAVITKKKFLRGDLAGKMMNVVRITYKENKNRSYKGIIWTVEAAIKGDKFKGKLEYENEERLPNAFSNWKTFATFFTLDKKTQDKWRLK